MVPFTDAAILTATPPRRACRSPVGEAAEGPVTGNRGEGVPYGALSPATGERWPGGATEWDRPPFRGRRRSARPVRRGWPLVLFVGRGGPHTATASRTLAAALGVALRSPPTARPELSPAEGLWRHAEGRVRADEPGPDRGGSLGRVGDERLMMSDSERRKWAGVRSQNSWLPT